jgi:hypothetical protein
MDCSKVFENSQVVIGSEAMAGRTCRSCSPAEAPTFATASTTATKKVRPGRQPAGQHAELRRLPRRIVCRQQRSSFRNLRLTMASGRSIRRDQLIRRDPCQMLTSKFESETPQLANGAAKSSNRVLLSRLKTRTARRIDLRRAVSCLVGASYASHEAQLSQFKQATLFETQRKAISRTRVSQGVGEFRSSRHSRSSAVCFES